MKLILALIFPVLVFAREVTIYSQSDVTPTLSSALAVSADKERKGLVITNKGADPVLLKFGSAHSGSEGIRIAAAGILDFNNVPMDSIYVMLASSTGTNLLNISEFK